MKHFALLVLLLVTPRLHAGELRQLAFELVPPELRLVKTLPEAKRALSGIPDIKKRMDADVLRVNYFGVNYDLNLGLSGQRIDWLTVRPPAKWSRATGLYQRMTLVLTPAQAEKTRARFQGKELVVDFDSVVLKFALPARELVEFSIRDFATGP